MSLDLHGPKFKKVSIKEIITPKPGKICYPPSWWVTDGENVFFYNKNRPQCNSDERVMNHLYPNEKTIFIEVAFLDHDCRDYI